MAQASLFEQFERIMALPDGFYDGYGKAYDRALTTRVFDKLNEIIAKGRLPTPSICPNVDNSLSVEWDVPGWHVAVDIFANNGLVAHLYSRLWGAETAIYRTYDLTNAHDIVKLSRILNALIFRGRND